MPFGFKGGIHPDDKKSFTARRAIEEMPAPKQVILPMSMHIGAPCNPLVSVGDRVLLGQRIAESTAPVSSPIHASVSGTVIAIEPRPHPNGTKVMSIVIENDFEDEKAETVPTDTRFADLSAEALSEICKNAGVVGLGGAAFPTQIKIKSAADKVDTLIIGGAMKAFEHSYIMTWGGPGVASSFLGVYMYNTTFQGGKFGMGSAISIVIMVLAVTFAILLKKFGRKFEY